MKNSNIKNKQTFNFNSLTFRVWTYFTLFAIGIFIVLWCMQVIFLQAYYSIMKKSEVNKIASQIISSYNTDGFDNKLSDISFRNLMTILIVDLDGNLIYNSNETNYVFENRSVKPTIIPLADILKTMTNNPKSVDTYTIKVDKYKTEMYVYAKMIPDTNYCLILSSSIDPIDATINVLKNQLEYVTIIAIVLSSIISIFMSKKIAKPIVRIEEKAKKLGKGEYDVKFEKSGFTEIDNLVDTLNYTTKELEKSDTLKKELIANVSHDLKTPLTMIKAYSEMIKDLYIDDKEKREKHLDVIIEETDRLSNLVTDMLDLSKLEANQIDLKLEQIDLVDITKKIVNTFKLLKENEEFNIKIESNEKALVLADKGKIEQVIYNLLGNAINYSNENKNILIKIEEIDNKVKYSVIDNGKGISEDELPYIWDRYYKADKNYQRPKTGSGLGLSITKNILELHNSKYGVESTVGFGTTFWFELNKEEIKS